jgi:hypothetical protein
MIVKSLMRSRYFSSVRKTLLKPLRSILPSVFPLPYEPGVIPLTINKLISPLRYDIDVRVSYFRFFEAHQDLFERDFDAYVAKARQHAYFTWFTEVYRIHNPNEFESEKEIESSFRKRIMNAARLYQRFHEIGFDRNTPIILASGDVILPTITAKRCSAHYYVSEGCHRIALMIMAGFCSLPPDTYCISKRREFRPLDNTSRLIRPLGVTPKEYFSFLSLGYADKEFTDKQSLLADVQAKDPKRVKELEAIIAADEMQF